MGPTELSADLVGAHESLVLPRRPRRRAGAAGPASLRAQDDGSYPEEPAATALTRGAKLEHLLETGTIAGIPFEGTDAIALVVNAPSTQAPGDAWFWPTAAPGLDAEEIAQAIRRRIIASATMAPGPGDTGMPTIAFAPTLGLGAEVEKQVVRQIILGEPARADLRALGFATVHGSARSLTGKLFAAMAWPRWSEDEQELAAQLAVLGMEVDPRVWIGADGTVLARAKGTQHYMSRFVLLAPNPQGAPAVAAVLALHARGISLDVAPAPERIDVVRVGFTLLGSALSAKDGHNAAGLALWAQAETILFPQGVLTRPGGSPPPQDWVDGLVALFTAGPTIARLDRLAGISEEIARHSARGVPAQVSRTTLLQAVDAEIEQARVAGEYARGAGWLLVRSRLLGETPLPTHCEKGAFPMALTQASGDYTRAHSRLGPVYTAIVPPFMAKSPVQSQLSYIESAALETLVKTTAETWLIQECRSRYAEPTDAPPVFVDLGEATTRITVRTEVESAQTSARDLPNPAHTEWARRQHVEALLADARKRVAENQGWYDPRITQTQDVQIVDSHGDTIRRESREVVIDEGRSDDSMYRALKAAEEDVRWYAFELSRLPATEPPATLRVVENCTIEWQIFEGTVSLPWSITQAGVRLEGGTETATVSERLLRVTGCESAGRTAVDQWETEGRTKSRYVNRLISKPGRRGGDVMSALVRQNAERRSAAASPAEGAWIRWFFDLRTEPGDADWVPFAFLDSGKGGESLEP